MLVRIRLHGGPKVRHKKRKNRHLALASAALLTPGAVMALVLSMWRLGTDIGFTSAFAIPTGVLSHWQVWLAISIAIQALALLLNRYGNPEMEKSDEGSLPHVKRPEPESLEAPKTTSHRAS